ncbi:MAG TPA: nucleotidyltransferase domain-containing protein [Bacillota bacterium]|nr:nucleotidyltransferase domain-containing protein [Bacillota bacterium]
MASLVTVDVRRVEETIRSIMPRFPEIAGVYLFGSALGPCRPDSDVDLGLVVDADGTSGGGGLARERLEARVAVAVGRLEGHPVDVVVLHPDDPIFSFKVIHSGRLIYIGDEARVTDFIELVAQRYREAYPRYQRALREIVDEVRQGGN